MSRDRETYLLPSVMAFVLTPALWPLSFIAIALTFPKAIDPLLGGIQYVLYFPGFIWLAVVLGTTVLIARLFHFRKSTELFLAVSVLGSLCAAIILQVTTWMSRIQMIGQPGVIFPSRVDQIVHFSDLLSLLGAAFAVSALTAIAFVGMRGLKYWQG